MKPVRVLIAESGSGYGGTAKYLTNLLPLLDSSRFAVKVITYGDGPFIRQIIDQGAEVHKRPQWRIAENRLRFFSQIFFQVPRIISWIRKEAIQVVHLNNEIHSHLPLLLASRMAGCRILCHLHGWRTLIRMEKWASQWVDQFVAVTQSGADFYSWQLKGREVLGIPNGLSMDGQTANHGEIRVKARQELRLEDNDILAVMIGRLIPLKGHSVFFQALAKAKKSQPRLRGLVVGNNPSLNGHYEQKLRKELEDLEISDRVQLLPWQAHMGPIYEASDIVVQPSIEAESFGYVALEGMSAGKPVIASNIGGLPEVVKEHETGLLVEPGNAGDLAQALNRIASDHEMAFKFGQQGRKRAKDFFTMERNARAITDRYEKLLT